MSRKPQSTTAVKSAPPAAPVAWRNRIVGEGMEDADQLLANPRNWRIHPKAQQDALEGVLREVGWVQRVIVNQRTGFVVDVIVRRWQDFTGKAATDENGETFESIERERVGAMPSGDREPVGATA